MLVAYRRAPHARVRHHLFPGRHRRRHPGRRRVRRRGRSPTTSRTARSSALARLRRGRARRFRHLAVTHAAGRRWLLVGLGARDAFDAERARIAAATAHGRARELGTATLCWELPHHVDDAVTGAFVEGTLLAAYRFDRYKARRRTSRRVEELIVSAHHDVSGPVGRGRVVAEAVNAARDLQNTPANDMTPAALADAARALEGVSVEVHGRDYRSSAAWARSPPSRRAADNEPALIVLRYDGADARGPVLGLVGKAVTFDTGGISIKPAAKMHEMKFDMSGGAAVVAAVGAIARLGLPVRVIGVVGATENMPSGHAMRPGDIVTASNGTTIEINNTDAEGRLVLGDCLTHAIGLGAERLVDIATLTGGDRDRARLRVRGRDEQRRRLVRGRRGGGRADRRTLLAPAAATRCTTTPSRASTATS